MITFAELQNKSNKMYPAVVLENFWSLRSRRVVRSVLFWLMVILVILWISSGIPFISGYIFTLIPDVFIARGLFFLFFSVWATLLSLDGFYLSHYFDEDTEVSLDVAKQIFSADPEDLTRSFLNSEIGRYVVMRLGIETEAVKEFVREKRNTLNDFEFSLEDDGDSVITMSDYGKAIYENDAVFARFLETRGITEETFLKTIDWIRNAERKVREKEAWWSRDNLARIPSVGRNWSFGKVYLIEKFGHSIYTDSVYRATSPRARIYKKFVESIENVLVKEDGSNVMVVGETSDIGLAISCALSKSIIEGTSLTELEDDRVFVLDSSKLIDESAEKTKFETNLNNLLVQAHNAGNVILVIPNFSSFVQSVHAIGSDLSSLLSDALVSLRVNVIALADRRGFHDTVEVHHGLMQYFEKIVVDKISDDTALEIAEEEALYLENRYDIFFTFPSVDLVVSGAARFFSEGNLTDKIVDLMQEICSKSISDNRKIITKKQVNDLITLKTGIPQGEIGASEQKELQSLEAILHKRVIGQNIAIESISRAIRRARSGITNPNRPVGSFLFIGPTGVGKTETTKTLAESFFHDENKILRFDMSEFSGIDALQKLIGYAGSGQGGVLSSKIRDEKYGVLLLDEFEKTTKEVLDLFLQIIDEGKFSDARGEEINVRNLIIIATSNAGSDLIFDAIEHGVDLSTQKDKIVSEIIQRKIFKPELINRFDGVVLFHPLMKEHLRQIARLMLVKLDKRLASKGIHVEINSELLDYLVEIGSNPKFGAREMNRVIQDEVEGLIADAIVSQSVKSGSLVKLSKNPQSGKLDLVL